LWRLQGLSSYYSIFFTSTDSIVAVSIDVKDSGIILDAFACMDSEIWLESIPTLTQWGVAILTLLVLAIGMAFVYRRQASLALAGEIDLAVSNTKPVFFDWKLLSKVFAVMLFIGIMVLLLMYRFNGNITGADPAGIFVSAAIVAYMVHLWILRKPEKRQE